eukprot:TRINITY_DN2517_c0_g1_i2.p1 TRINITY_DN2517_c0_g1~~TRINITY_DN2517_c0_g1_i2.p1  ORF type:complete len:445 (+),score=94.91 TRINITY_DN2517_c0_g1_i2:512-1846(+)
MIYYALETEEALVAAVDEAYPNGNDIDKTVCKLLAMQNNTAIDTAIKGGYLIISEHSATHTASFRSAYPLTHSDLWISTIVMCDPSDYNPLPIGTHYTATGRVTFISPTGYLSSLHYSYLEFHMYNSLCLLILLVLWGVFCLVRRDYATKVHLTLGAMLFVSVLEQFAMWMFLKKVNDDGGDALTERYVAIVMEAIRKVIWCFLLLLLVHGYRTIHATLKEARIAEIVGITVIYALVCATSFTYDPRDTLNQKSVEGIQSSVTFFIYVYVINKLAATIEKLKAEKQRTKQALYQNLFSLIVGYIASWFVVFVILVVVFSTTSRAQIEKSWEGWWALYASDPILFELLLVLLMILWRPSESSSRLLYSIELGAEDDDAPGPDEDIFAGLDDNNEAAVATGNPLAAIPTGPPGPQPEIVINDREDGDSDVAEGSPHDFAPSKDKKD